MASAVQASCSRVSTQSSRSVVHRFPRSRLPVAAATREAQLAQLREFQAGLTERLQAASTSGAAEPATAAPPAPAAAAEAARKELREVTKDDFYAVLAAAGNRLVVVDCYTDWCGPCKMIAPILEQWAAELEGKVDIVKFNCNKYNKELGVKLGIKVAPTFLLYKNEAQVASMSGAKVDQLRALMEQHM